MGKMHWIFMVATSPVTRFLRAMEMAGLDLQGPALTTRPRCFPILVVFGCPMAPLSKDQRRPGHTHHLPAWKNQGLATWVVGRHSQIDHFFTRMPAVQTQLRAPSCRHLLVGHLVALFRWMPQILGPGTFLIKVSIHNTQNLAQTVFGPTLWQEVPQWGAPVEAAFHILYEGHFCVICQCCTQPTHGLNLCCSLEPQLAEVAPAVRDAKTRRLLSLSKQISGSLV